MITVITPSVRREFLQIVQDCLDRQTFTDFEWIVVGPEGLLPKGDFSSRGKSYYFIKEPPGKKGDFYNLNKAWNEGFREAEGELVVSIVDGIWFPPNTLENLWNLYRLNPMSCIGLTGNQYAKIENGKPEGLVWTDPRIREDSTFYEIPPYDLELCIASLPLKGIKDVGGVDEEFDKFPAWSEKDLACRMSRIGYKCFLDQAIQYRAIYHPRLSDDWDNKYPKSTEYFLKCYNNKERLVLDYLEN